MLDVPHAAIEEVENLVVTIKLNGFVDHVNGLLAALVALIKRNLNEIRIAGILKVAKNIIVDVLDNTVEVATDGVLEVFIQLYCFHGAYYTLISVIVNKRKPSEVKHLR
jgi:chaperonin GroEL (HSP60 family)